ncbi:MAG: CbiX/SirB N-terminal domain-containing protein [Pseudomonadota bacterium]|jgi:sirohydrochlorin cobaltochelatase
MSTDTALILFAHGARDPQWAEPFQAVRTAIARRAPGVAVELAFLELMSPSLGEAVDRVVARGARRVVVVPAFMAQGGHLKRDLPRLIGEVQAVHPRCVIEQTRAIGEVPEIIEAIAAFALAQTGS